MLCKHHNGTFDAVGRGHPLHQSSVIILGQFAALLNRFPSDRWLWRLQRLVSQPQNESPAPRDRARHKAHARRKFTDILAKNPSPVAAEAVVRVGELSAIERDIKGAPPDERRRVCQQLAAPKLAALRPWLEAEMRGLSSDSALAKACRYPLNRWTAMARYCDNGLLEISNNLVENVLRGAALGRRN